MSGSGFKTGIAAPRDAGGPRPGPRWMLPRVCWLLVFACAVPFCGVGCAGCSSKPAAKQRSKSTAARLRPETGLAELAAAPGSGDASMADEQAPASTGETSAVSAGDGLPEGKEPLSAPDPAANPAPTASTDSAPPPTSLSDLAAGGGSRGAKRPSSPLVDSDTALVLDGGRIEVCSPTGWTRSPRSANHLVRYQPGPRKTYPSIVVTAEPAPVGLENVGVKEQAGLVAALAAKLAETFPADGTVKLIKKPVAATFGDHAGVAWAMPGTAQVGGLSEPIERFAYGIVLGGRLYTVEARAPKGKVDDDAKAAAKAVTATLFRPAEAPVSQPEAAAAPPEAEPAPAEPAN